MKTNLNENLMKAVSSFDVKAVKDCLEKGADPNYTVSFGTKHEEIFQPTTPLKLVMFRISDCMLEDDNLINFADIAKLLIKYGALTEPAMQIAESRYGKYDPNMELNPFNNVWHIIATAQRDKI